MDRELARRNFIKSQRALTEKEQVKHRKKVMQKMLEHQYREHKQEGEVRDDR